MNRIFKSKCRQLRFIWQRLVRGWDDSDTWGLDHTFARFAVPRLKKFQQLNTGTPGIIAFQDGDHGHMVWDDILDKIIRAFELSILDDTEDLTNEQFKEMDEGLFLFAKWYRYLWW